MSEMDPRLTPHRPDLASIALRGRVDAARFVAPSPMRVSVTSAGLRGKPSADASYLTEALLGEDFDVLETADGWAWGQLRSDGYVGYLPLSALSPVSEGAPEPTHKVAVPFTHLYAAANMKTPPVMTAGLGSALTVIGEEGDFLALADGRFAYARHLRPLGETVTDFVAVAEWFLGAPYAWGGKLWTGIDCSGLVQVSLAAAGIKALRDSDMQEKSLGHAIDSYGFEDYHRGDLIFWPGHVGIMRDEENLIHASGYHMQVVTESLVSAVERIAARGVEIRTVRRIPRG
jgi:cell wall-associated NlpC family hydrolase